MSKWEIVDTASIPNNGGELRLFQRDNEFAIRIAGGQGDLMNSRTHGSEDALGTLACEPFQNKPGAKILVGGLGMGFTLATALQSLRPDAQVIVAELVPGVVQWNIDLVGGCAGNPLDDDRVQVRDADVGELINRATKTYDAILLDVDNGPEGLTHIQNDNLYSPEGLQAAYSALRPAGILAVWSATSAPKFKTQLRKAGFSVDERRVRAHQGKGSTHLIWLAQRGR
ncbi:MAG: spermidine synthase [Candidatus Azotimanducaceae bacterium]